MLYGKTYCTQPFKYQHLTSHKYSEHLRAFLDKIQAKENPPQDTSIYVKGNANGDTTHCEPWPWPT